MFKKYLMAESNGAKLHSRYNPRAEAVRYIDSLNLKSSLNCFILIEPGLGYIIPVLRERFTKGKIIVLHIENFEKKAEIASEPPPDEGLQVIEATFPPETEPALIQQFLEAHIQEENTSNIKIIEWRPSLNLYKDAYVKLFSRVLEYIKRADAGFRTTAVFGRRWVRNFFRNLKYLNKILLYRQSDIPVIVTGSGPGLEQALPFIRRARGNCMILAASSSVTALYHNGIAPDIIITTDGAPWALWHILSGIRSGETRSVSLSKAPYALNLCAALPSQCADAPKLIINDGSLWQSIVLRELSIPSVIIPQRGTVSATAVELAMTLSLGSIYTAGMDFSFNDIRTHVKPYGFDNLFNGRANRLAPLYTELFTRSALIREGGSMDIYAAWFKNQLSSWPERIYSITDGNNIFNYKNELLLRELQEKQIKTKDITRCFNIVNLKDEYAREILTMGARSNAKKSGMPRSARALFDAMKNPEYKEKLTSELTSLLFPGETDIKTDKLEASILRISDVR